MYESFFRFNQRPFAAAPRIDRYFPGKAIEAARLSLARSIDRAEGTALLIGPAGTGKTLVCHLLAEQFRGRFAVAMLSNGHLDSRRELLQAILFELGLPYRRLEEGELRLSLIDYVANGQTSHEGLLLLVDEAHTLPVKLLEEVRLIANIVRQGQPRVRLVLAGNSGLEESLADPQLEALSQRVATRSYLDGLDHAQTQEYIVAQVSTAGGDARRLFSADALEAVYQATGGIPRLVNQVCDHALILAFAGGRQQIDAAGVEEAWSDLQQLPTPRGDLQRMSAKAPNAEDALIEFGNLDELAPPTAMQESTLDAHFFAPAGEVGPAAEATLLMHQIDDHLIELARDFSVAVSSCCDESPAAHTADPFGEPFDQEEVLLDRYSALEPDSLTDHRLVESDEGRALAALLTSFVEAGSSELSLLAAARNENPAWLVSSGVGNVCFQSTTIDAAEPSRHGGLSSLGMSEEDFADDELDRFEAPDADWSESPAVPLVRTIAPTNEYDDDLMIVEDDPRPEIRVHGSPSARQVRRQEFRQLFSSLRRG